jgi:polysaccharide biosynthesis protein
MRFITKLLNTLGIDGAIFYTSLGRILQGLGGIITLILISKFMSKEEQGFYYTFMSVLALQMFFELGLNGILSQFVAHEMAFLKVVDNDHLEGEENNLSRLTSIFHFTIKWYSFFSILLITVLIVVGFFYFHRYAANSYNIHWQMPWLLLSIFTGLNLFLSPITSILYGICKVKDITRFQMLQQLFVMFSVWIALLLEIKLYVLIINVVANILFLIVYFYFHYRKLLKNILLHPITNKIDYWKEIFPYQWKIALSTISNYFVFQCFTPITFAFYGAVVAGQMGMSLMLSNSIYPLVASWCVTKVPLWSSLVARKEFVQLTNSLKMVVKQSIAISLFVISVALTIIYIAYLFKIPIVQRILPVELCAILFLAIPFNLVINVWATYLRCNKKDPFMIQAVMGGIFIFLQAYLSAKYFDLPILIMGYTALIAFINFPIAYAIFKTKKREYYGQ